MVHGLKSEPYRMPVTGIIGEILFEVPVADMGIDLEIVVVVLYFHLIFVIAIDQRGIGEQLPVQNAVPSKGGRGIAPVGAERITHAQDITTKIARQINAVILIDLVIGFGVEIVEIKFVILIIFGCFQKQIGIGTPARNNKGRFVFLDRALHGQAAGNQADSPRNGIVLFVTILHFDIHHRGKSSAILRGTVSLNNTGILQGIAVEGAEESKQM
jgi:hypothetical protein